tara:strand:+ start:700 stop:1740 length:1041 start_codon:yes stop_codon:yes gene_type:complete
MDEDKPATYRQRNPAVDSDEIDLVELFQCLWQQKLLIMAFVAVATIAAAAFAFLSPPEYEAKAGVLPPRLSDIAGYNLGRESYNIRCAEAEIDRFAESDVYGVFKTNLLSVSLKNSFLRETPSPSSAVIKVHAPDVKRRPDFYEVVVKHKSPELAAKWANLYVDMAEKKTEQDMQENMLAEVAVKIQVIERQIDALRTTAEKRRKDRVVRLREALAVVETAGLDAPLGMTYSVSDLAPFIDGNLMYLRGAKAIRAELTVLEKRENDDPFINELRDLENQLDFLRKIDVNLADVSVLTLDSRAEVPKTPVKPRKAIILVLGVIVGGMFGVFAALIRGMLKKRKMQVD